MRVGRVLSNAGGVYTVETGGTVVEAHLRGRVKQNRNVVSAGDLVEIEQSAEAKVIASVLPRANCLARRRAGPRVQVRGVTPCRGSPNTLTSGKTVPGSEQVIVANLDQLAAVFAVGRPGANWSMVDRLVAHARLGGIHTLLVLNKTDLGKVDPPQLGNYLDLGLELLRVSAVTGEGTDALADRLRGRVTALAGQSGVGKTSLLNALVPGLGLRVREVSRATGLGRHTTVRAELFPFLGGGYVADTPGIGYMAMTDSDPARVEGGFAEIEDAAAGCRFSNCLHRAEPGCAVTRGVRQGVIPGRRHRSYLRLLEEAEAVLPY